MKRNKQQKLLFYTNPRTFEKKLQEMEEVEEQVAWLLQKDEHLRNNDNLLIWAFWNEVNKPILRGVCKDLIEFGEEIIPYPVVHLVKAESITRCRRMLQNTLGLFLPTDTQVIEERKISEAAVKEWAELEGGKLWKKR